MNGVNLEGLVEMDEITKEDHLVALVASTLIAGLVGRPKDITGVDPMETMKLIITASVRQARAIVKETVKQRLENKL